MNEFYMIDKFQKALVDLAEHEGIDGEFHKLSDKERNHLRDEAYRWIICLTEKV